MKAKRKKKTPKQKKREKRQKDYQKYLKTRHWQKTRKQAMRKARGRCKKCGKAARDIHHKTYKRVGKEKQSDLMALCRECHQKQHGIGQKKKNWRDERKGR